MKAYERFITYVKTHTASSETSESVPSSDCQFTLCHMLADEMRALGLEGVYEDEHAYVYGFIPASEGYEDKPCIGFIAHLDTIPDFPGENVQPQLIENYDGGNVVLGTSGRSLTVEKFPHLATLKGQTLITTDGTTVLGADDKAGIAAIMTAAERIINEKRPHGRVAVCFTPDEEIGHGAGLLDLDELGAAYGYTVDGETLGEFNYECFSACEATVRVRGVMVHPGSAKDVMVNAITVASEFEQLVPAWERPEHTCGREGFYHPTDIEGSASEVTLKYILRDFDADKFAARQTTFHQIAELLNGRYGEGTVTVEVRQQYRNMAEHFEGKEFLIDNALEANREAGLAPSIVAVRGGTDGAQLTFRGLLCPNIGTGGYSCHGPYEHITAEHLETSANIVLNIIDENLK